MECPACGSGLRQRESRGGALFLLCSKWPECRIAGTPTLMNRFDFLREEVIRLEARLKESRGQVSGLLKKLKEAARDKPEPEFEPGRISQPTAIGELAGPVAELRALQSRYNAAKTDDEQSYIREEIQAMKRTLFRCTFPNT